VVGAIGLKPTGESPARAAASSGLAPEAIQSAATGELHRTTLRSGEGRVVGLASIGDEMLGQRFVGDKGKGGQFESVRN
jgi:hypothetical protein